jgi:hypothetical protein
VPTFRLSQDGLIDRTRYWRRGELLVFKAELEAAKARGWKTSDALLPWFGWNE